MKYHILVVDDEPDIQALICQKFRREIRKGQYSFAFVSDGEQAYQKIAAHPELDMVLTDLNMPVMGGLALLEKIHMLPSPPKVIVVSAFGDMDNIRTAMNNGAFDFLTKPIDLQDLVITFKKTLKIVAELKTNQKLLEQARLQTEKMALIGELVSGVAHEINNPLSFLQGNLQPAREYIKDLLSVLDFVVANYGDRNPKIAEKMSDMEIEFIRKDLPKLLDSMQLGIDRIRNISSSLRVVSRQDRYIKVNCDIREGIDSALTLLKHRTKANKHHPAIKIIKKYQDIPKIDCFIGQLNQVFMNILANAIDSFEAIDRNRSYAEIEADPNCIIIEVFREEEQIKIRIQDNGCGIKPEIQERIFEQGFTTKAVGKGTGLGMAIAYQIVTEKHGGTLTCDSTFGRGTTFEITLPIRENQA